MTRVRVPGGITVGLSKPQVKPDSDEETEQVRATVPEKPCFGVTLSGRRSLKLATVELRLTNGGAGKCIEQRRGIHRSPSGDKVITSTGRIAVEVNRRAVRRGRLARDVVIAARDV